MMKLKSLRPAFAALIAALGLCACSQSTLRLSPDFGQAVRQDTMAQIADPDAHYKGVPAPGSNGVRVDLAQTRYQKNDVVQPSEITASGSSSVGKAENGNSGGVSAGMSQ